MTFITLKRPRTAIVAVLAASALVAAGCGGGEGEGGDTAEQAFLQSMVPHHTSAIEMTEIAEERAESGEIMEISEEIASIQEEEIAEMEAIHERLFGEELEPDHTAHEGLGLSAEEAGMDHLDAAAGLESAEPFDQAFVDEMVPHHEGATAMAEAVLAETDDEELRQLAEGIVQTQEQEIERMNAFRVAEYGAPVPESGGEVAEPEGGGTEEHPSGHSG
jgi:uncharacterized protein (DUF305 family)